MLTFTEAVRLEMDLRFEAAAASELAENFAGDPTFRVPQVDWRRTGRAVLTTERISGIRVDDREALNTEAHAVIEKRPSRIGTSVLDHFAHSREQLWIDLPPCRNLASDPAHGRAGIDVGRSVA